jgi:Arc/MetJ-type ribon-helix-helix transcriptional regulator
MAKSNTVIRKKKRGRPATGQDPVSAIRLPAQLTAAIDKWAAKTGAPSRSEAIRRLVEQALADAQPSRKRSERGAAKARDLAGHALNRLADESVPIEERERRKRRLTKGPGEFRDIRADLPKPKG